MHVIRKYFSTLLFIGLSFKIFAQCPKNIGDTIHFSGININIGAWYPLDGNANDSSGNANDGTVYNAYPAPDRFGNTNMAYQFNGGGNYISIPGHSAHEPKDSLTVSAWIYMDDSTSVWHFFLTKRINRNANPGNSYALYGGNPNKPQYLAFSNGNNSNEAGIDYKNAYTKRWYFLTGTYNKNKSGDYRGFFYVNGKLIDSFKQSGEIYYIHSNPLYIGQAYDNSANPPIHMQGRIDDVRVYQKDLCAQEIRYLYGDRMILDAGIKSQNSCIGVGDSALVFISNPEPNVKYYLCDAKDSSVIKGPFSARCEDTLSFYAVKRTANVSFILKAVNSDNSCSIFLDKTISFSSAGSDFVFSNSNPCPKENIQISVSKTVPNGVYLWKIDNTISSGSSTNYTPQNFGKTNVKLIYEYTLNGNTCKDSIIKQLNVKENPKAVYSVNELSQCLRKNEFFFTNHSTFSDTSLLIFTWKSGANIGTSNYKNFNYSYANPGTYRSVLIAFANGCSDSSEIMITVLPSPDVSFTVNNVSQCMDNQNFIVKSKPSADDKKWTWSDGTKIDNVDSLSHKFASYGNYKIKLFAISVSNCEDSSERNLEVNPVPKIGFEIDTVCFSEATTIINKSSIDAGNISKYEWKIENQTYQTKDVSHIFSKVGNFDIELTATSDKGCISFLHKDTIAVISAKPIADFSLSTKEDSILGLVVEFKNKSQNAINYTWNLSTGETESDFEFIKSYVIDTLTLRVQLIAMNDDGCADTAYQTIFIESYSEILVPNAFSPNSDELNAVFRPLGIFSTTDYDFSIYNRWGELIFETDDFKEGWNGTFKGKKVENGIYIYRIYYRGANKKQQNFKGKVMLLR